LLVSIFDVYLIEEREQRVRGFVHRFIFIVAGIFPIVEGCSMEIWGRAGAEAGGDESLEISRTGGGASVEPANPTGIEF
jgi:hypothetical protein